MSKNLDTKELILSPEEIAIINLMRSVGKGTIEALDVVGGKPYRAKTGMQILDFTDAKTQAMIEAGLAVSVNMTSIVEVEH